ncbi:MAG TPA: sporulation integral membrane protein YtvI [Firmicutes bacterium]|jgi:sporulation integral membrane protein YtvI|nr:sporulation integral membrane protein YtvI [Bacillota bacterium]
MEQRKQFVINASYFAIIAGIAYLVMKYVLGLVAPFIIGFLVALVLQRSITFFSAKLRLPKKLAAVLLVLVFYAVLGVLLFWLAMSVFAGVKVLVERLPAVYANDIEPFLMDVFESVERIMLRFDMTVADFLEDFHVTLSQSLGKIVSEVSSAAISAVTSAVSSVPKAFFGIVLAVISSAFFAMDFEMVMGFFQSLLPAKWQGMSGEIRAFSSNILGKYLKAYALIMLITFTEMAVGLSILGVNGAIPIAAFTAVVDVLPVLGTGGIVIPWGLFNLVRGNLFLGFGLLVLYVVITFIRQAVEPRLVGQQIGLHPIVVLLCMYAGLKLFGVVGLFGLPITILVIKYFYTHGKGEPAA